MKNVLQWAKLRFKSLIHFCGRVRDFVARKMGREQKKHRLHFYFWPLYLLGVFAFLFLMFLNFYPVGYLFDNALSQNTKIFDRNGILLYETLHPEKGKTTTVDLANVPKYLIDATIATEDKNFYSNSGVDVFGVVRAVFLNLKEGRVVSGGSTITQQLVRNLSGTTNKRTFFRKIGESFLAMRVSKVLTKEEVLTLYFNTIYYGNLNYGIEAASEGYFGKHVVDLDLAESAFLAGLPQAPNRYDPFKSRDAALQRKNYVLSLMLKEGFISQDEFNAAKNENLAFEQNLVTVRATHFVNYVIEELEDYYGGDFVSAGLEVKTTLDYYLQQKIQNIAQRNISILVGRNVNNASAVVLKTGTAEIYAMLGSIDYFDKKIDGQVNVATSERQPGSAFKPITYAAAFEKGWNGATLLKDEPVRFFTAEGTPYMPKNYDYEYHGLVTVRNSLANSYNIPAVLAAEFATPEAVLKKALAFGLSTLDKSADHYGLAITLGDGEVRLLDLTSAYMVFADAGIKRTPQAIAEIKNAQGELIYQMPYQSGKRVVDEDISFMITDILADKEARIPEFGLNNVLELDRPAAVKTGTTRNFRDNWTVGFTPDFVTGVWVGNSDNYEMHDISGIYGAGPIWHDIMQELHLNLEKKSFEVPASVEKKEFCLDEVSENKTPENCSKKVWEWVSKRHLSGSVNAEKPLPKPALIIKKPFDLDAFKISSTRDFAAQQVKFQVEKAALVGEVVWFVNSEEVGKGDEIFWQLQKGQFEIQAKSADGAVSSEPINIFVE